MTLASLLLELDCADPELIRGSMERHLKEADWYLKTGNEFMRSAHLREAGALARRLEAVTGRVEGAEAP